ncbi:MAG: cob(I)yrinic acid a,c-diamide adenosyltransferase [Bacteroidetes bacterium]|nr:cob(I)yrinic acid a,c-diamide adenosyltransferase [Bacteroidota bacterium]
MAKSISTRTGDDGTTSLIGGTRVPKHHPRIEAVGEIDALTSVLGVIRSFHPPKEVDTILQELQYYFFIAGTDVAAPGSTQVSRIEHKHIHFVEASLSTFEHELPVLSTFILPVGSPTATHIHCARAHCRKVERILSFLASTELINPLLLPFFNRCSDLLFMLARYTNMKDGHSEQPIHSRKT